MPGLKDYVPAVRPGFVVGSPHQDGFIDRKSNRQDGSYEVDALVADAISPRASSEGYALGSVIEAKNAGQVREWQREGDIHVPSPLVLVLGVDRNVDGVSSLAKLADPTAATCSPIMPLVDVDNFRIDVQVLELLVSRKAKLTVRESGWFLVRAIADDVATFRFASSAPFYVEVGKQDRRISKASVRFFLEWIDERLAQLEKALPDAAQRREVLSTHTQARQFWKELAGKANAD